MNLNDFQNVVLAHMNRPDNDSRLACATFVDKNYRTIYDAFPWRDSEVVSDPIDIVQGNHTTLDPIPVPSTIERVVKVGLFSTLGGTRAVTDLRPTDYAQLLETRPDVINVTGVPEFYEEINTSIVQTSLSNNSHLVKLYPKGAANYQIVIVGKKPYNALRTSTDVPIVRNINNVLIAFTLADMLKRDRQYAKAAQQLQEAQTLLQEAIALEQKQSNAPRAARPLSVTGGTLAELTDAVASRTSMWDLPATIRIQEAVRRRYQELYDRELWTESIVIFRQQAQEDILILPSFIDNVEAVISDATAMALSVQELEYQFRTTPDIFDLQGTPVTYSILTPVAVEVLPEVAEQLQFTSDNSFDSFDLTLEGEADGIYRKEIVQVRPTTANTSAYSYDTPTIISKPLSLGTLSISGASSLIKYGEIPADTSSILHQRLLVQPTNTDTLNTTYLILGKRKLKQLVNATDAVSIRGCESALIAAACGDVVDPAAAAPFKDEFEKQYATLVQRETNQTARRVTITPYTDRTYTFADEAWMTGA